MSNPSEVFRRIRRRNAGFLRQPGSPSPTIPAPAPAGGLAPAAPTPPGKSAPPSSTPWDAPSRPTADGRRAAPPSASGHALYSELMRSHDRMGTRHLSRNG